MKRRWLPLALLLFAFALRAGDLGGPSLWYDEAYIWWVTTTLTLREMLALSLREIIPPFYYLLMRGWIPLGGASEFALRYPSALLGVLGVAAAGRLTLCLTGRRSGAYAALALFAIATPLLWAARETRMYGPLLTWTLIASMALLETLRPGHHRAWPWLWAAATLAACYTLILAPFWLAGQGMFVLLTWLMLPTDARRAVFHALWRPALAVVLLFASWALAALGSLGVNAGYWSGHLPPAYFAEITFRGLTTGDFLPEPWNGAAALSVLLVAALSLLTTRRQPRAGLYPLCYALPLVAMAYLFQSMPKWGTRHAVLFAPAPLLALTVAWGMARRRWATGILTAGTLLVVAVFLAADAHLLGDPAFAHDDWRGVAQYVQARRAPGDGVIIETGSVFPAWLYYGGAEGLLPLPEDSLLDVNHVLDYRVTAAALNAQLAEAEGVWVVQWLADVTDPTGIVLALLDEIGTAQPTPDFHNLVLYHYQLAGPPAFPSDPPTTACPEIEVLPAITLEGYWLPPAPHSAGAPLPLRMWWTTATPTAHTGRVYQSKVELLDAQGVSWGWGEGPLGGGDYRPERWRAGELVFGPLSLTVDPWAAPGIYTPTLTVYTFDGAQAVTRLHSLVLTRSLTLPDLPLSAYPVAAVDNVPLQLLGVSLESATVTPCGWVQGRLYWEARVPRAALTLFTAFAGQQARVSLPPAWQAGDRFATAFSVPVDCRAEAAAEPLHIALHAGDAPLAGWEGPHLELYARREYAAPEDLLPLTVSFGDNFAALLGYQLAPPTPQAGVPFTLTLIWQAGVTDDIPRSAFVHITAADGGPLLAQHDAWPTQGTRPTHTWRPGEIVSDQHPFTGLPAGDYHLWIGLYSPDATRLLTSDGTDAVRLEMWVP